MNHDNEISIEAKICGSDFILCLSAVNFRRKQLEDSLNVEKLKLVTGLMITGRSMEEAAFEYLINVLQHAPLIYYFYFEFTHEILSQPILDCVAFVISCLPGVRILSLTMKIGIRRSIDRIATAIGSLTKLNTLFLCNFLIGNTQAENLFNDLSEIKTLKSLSVENCFNCLGEYYVGKLISKSISLKSLHFSHAAFDVKCLAAKIVESKSLKKIGLTMRLTQMNARHHIFPVIEAISKSETVKTFYLTGNTIRLEDGDDPIIFKNLFENTPNLSKLDLADCCLDYTHVPMICEIIKANTLERLFIDDNHDLTRKDIIAIVTTLVENTSLRKIGLGAWCWSEDPKTSVFFRDILRRNSSLFEITVNGSTYGKLDPIIREDMATEDFEVELYLQRNQHNARMKELRLSMLLLPLLSLEKRIDRPTPECENGLKRARF